MVGARLRTRSCTAALPAARALAVKRAPRLPPSFTPRRLARRHYGERLAQGLAEQSRARAHGKPDPAVEAHYYKNVVTWSASGAMIRPAMEAAAFMFGTMLSVPNIAPKSMRHSN